ncbi:MAG: MFS transporter [Oscillospiraceae bacterium]|nr:MFS transporter [Oscillospiraceae bacterium]
MNEIRIGSKVISRDFLLFLIANALLGIAVAVESTSFANRLIEDLNFDMQMRAFLEFPRELPGLLVVFIIGALGFLGDIRTAAVGNIVGGIGLFAFGLVPYGFWPVVVTMMIFSMGQHIYLPLSGAISMTFAKKDNLGRRLGEIQAVNTAMLIVTAAVLYLLYHFLDMSFSVAFSFGAVAMVLAGVVLLFMSPGEKKPKKERFVVKKKYSLFYVLALFFGARRQITFTFVTWLIATIYNQPVQTFVILFFITNVISIFFRPILGIFIDKLGERFVLVFEGGLLLLSCFGFAFAKVLFSPSVALVVVGICFVIDNLFSVGAQMARTTYVRKLADNQNEVSGTLSFSISLDHVLTMSLPFFVGMLWEWNAETGYIYVFLVGAVISIVCMLLANAIRIPERSEHSVSG